MDVIDHIRQMQAQLEDGPAETPEHNPEMLLIGCIDARLPVHSIGIPRGRSLIMRQIAALISGRSGIARRPAEIAALEFALVVKKVRHIAVMGHTVCGGIRACLEKPDLPHLPRYLAPLDPVHRMIVKQGGSLEEQARRMEQEAVRQSLHNLRRYPMVAEAEREGRVKLHGWVVDVATQHLSVLDETTGVFSPMTGKKKK